MSFNPSSQTNELSELILKQAWLWRSLTLYEAMMKYMLLCTLYDINDTWSCPAVCGLAREIVTMDTISSVYLTQKLFQKILLWLNLRPLSKYILLYALNKIGNRTIGPIAIHPPPPPPPTLIYITMNWFWGSKSVFSIGEMSHCLVKELKQLSLWFKNELRKIFNLNTKIVI